MTEKSPILNLGRAMSKITPIVPPSALTQKHSRKSSSRENDYDQDDIDDNDFSRNIEPLTQRNLIEMAPTLKGPDFYQQQLD